MGFSVPSLKSIHDITTTRRDIRYGRKASEIELELLRVVTNLSMTIPQLFARHFGGMGRTAVMLPLEISTRFYASRRQKMELDWIWSPDSKEELHVYSSK